MCAPARVCVCVCAHVRFVRAMRVHICVEISVCPRVYLISVCRHGSRTCCHLKKESRGPSLQPAHWPVLLAKWERDVGESRERGLKRRILPSPVRTLNASTRNPLVASSRIYAFFSRFYFLLFDVSLLPLFSLHHVCVSAFLFYSHLEHNSVFTKISRATSLITLYGRGIGSDSFAP